MRFLIVTGISHFAVTVFAPFLEANHSLSNEDANLLQGGKTTAVFN